MKDAKVFEEKLRRAKQDSAYFAKAFLGKEAFPYQVEFLRDAGPRIAAACGRQVGKTTLAAIKGLHFAFFNPDVTVLIVSSSLRQSTLLFTKIKSMVETNALLRLKVRRSTGTTIEFDHNSRIVALPCGPTGYSLRGYTSDMVIMDEANFVPENVVESVIRPMLITRPSSRLIMLSTPVTKDHPFYRAVSQKEQGFHVYSWATRLNPLVTPEKLEAERNAVDESTFLKEYEAQFTEEANCYFPGHLILQCVDGEHELLKDEDVLQRKFQGNFNLGVDFGKRVDYTVLAVVEKLSNETLRLIYLKQLPLGTEYSSAVGWVKRLNEAFSPISCKLDRTGVGEAPAEDVKRIIPNMEGITLTTKVKVDLLSNLLVLMERKRLILPPDRELIAQISNQQYEVVKSGELLFSHPPRAHDDQLWALALSAWRTPNSWGSIIPVKKSF